MLHSLLRLGPLPQDLNRSAFRKTAIGLTAAAALAGASVFASFPANAQQASLPLTAQQCSEAQDVAFAVMKRYPISAPMAASFRSFRTSNCDLNTDWNTTTPTDEKAFGEFRVKLIALRKVATAASPQLAAK